jgi:type II secretory pathway predicted ATPase ExeA
MTTKKLQSLLQKHGMSQASIARACGVGKATIHRIAQDGQWPSDAHKGVQIRQALMDAFKAQGVSTKAVAQAIVADLPKDKAQSATSKYSSGPHHAVGKTAAPTAQTGAGAKVNTEGVEMLLRKQMLSEGARKLFCPDACPFTDDVQCAEDVYRSGDVRYVISSLRDAAKNGGLLAIVGESGAGKSTVLAWFKDHLARESQRTVVVEPYVLAMEANDIKGKTLKSAAIAEAIIAAVAPQERMKRSPEARFKQLHSLLQSSARNGGQHVLVIEEAHCLPKATLKHLKRFAELKDGFKSLLAIVLIGQPELRNTLSEHNKEVREVVQRCSVATLAAIDGNLLDYLTFKFKRVGVQLDKVLDKGAVEQLQSALTHVRSSRPGVNPKQLFGSQASVSYAYPLAVANLLIAAMNDAAELGAPKVTAELIKAVRA